MSHNVGSTRMSYGSYQFMPIPLMSWNKELVKDSKDDRLYIKNTVDFTGSLLETLPTESGSFPTMMQQRQLLADALTASGVLEWRITYEGNTVLDNIFPQTTNLTFEEGVWVDRINYGFTFEFNESISGVTPVQSFNETWDFEEAEDQITASVSHNISAVGVNTSASGAANNALTNARTFVLARAGYSNVPAGHPAFIAASGTVAAYEGRRTENVDVGQGSFSINETFILSSGAYVHTYSYQLSTNNLGVSVVNLDGNIRGLGRDGKAYPRAYAGWLTIKNNLPAEASGAYSELGGHATLYTNNYESFSLTRNKLLGTLDYSVSYTDDSTQNLPSGIQDFSITVQDDKPVRLFASFAIMERSLGNVVQDIGTSTEGRFVISGTAVGEQGFPFDDLIAYCETRINELRPLPVNYVTLRLEQRSVTKDEPRNTVNFTLTWIYTKDLSNVFESGDVVLD